jgi:hypothetical protein
MSKGYVSNKTFEGQYASNCMVVYTQLKFAKQCGTPIVPAMCQDPQTWKPSGWLGIVTAGSLWSPLFFAGVADSFDDNIDNIIHQIKQVLPTVEAAQALHAPASARSAEVSSEDHEEEEEEEEDLFSVGEMRAELERLRREAAVADGATPTLPRDADGPAALPSAVPEIPTGMCISDSMHLLVQTVISPESKMRVGFHGMGGASPGSEFCTPLAVFTGSDCGSMSCLYVTQVQTCLPVQASARPVPARGCVGRSWSGSTSAACCGSHWDNVPVSIDASSYCIPSSPVNKWHPI